MVAEAHYLRAATTKYGQGNKMNKTIHNIITGEVLISAMTQNEIDKVNSQAEILKAETTKVLEAQAEAKAAKVAEKAALLARLGITAEEATLLLGGN